MSYQKRNWKIARPSLSKGARGCNKPSTETRAEKLARKERQRAKFHAAAQDWDRITRIMAGTHTNRHGLTRDRHTHLPHEGEREVARRLRQSARASA